MVKEEIYTFNEPLSKHTTFKIGGPAKIWVEPIDIDGLREVLRDINSKPPHQKFWCGGKGLRYRVIGNGSNILAGDKGVRGVIIKLSNFRELTVNNNKVIAGSGVGLDELIKFSAKHGLSGLEFLSGIPGTVGGAIKTNAGAQTQEIADILEEIEVMDRDGRIYKIPSSKIEFGYRYSDIKEDIIILGGMFRLITSSYEEINNKIKTILEERRDRFPLEYPSAGSVFKNPDGISAGKLIDRLGLRGTVYGRAMVSNKHANIIVNLGGAKAEDVERLIIHVKDRVYNETGINLELEIECW